MGLSEREQQVLREIELSLMADDPAFGEGFSHEPARAPKRSFASVLGVVLGLVVLVAGVALSQVSLWFVALSAVGFLLMFLSAVMLLRGTGGTTAAEQLTPEQLFEVRRSSAQPQRRSKLGDRMEQRFRDRFEGNN